MRMNWLIVTSSGSFFIRGGKSLAAWFITISPNAACKKKFNMQLLCQTVGRNGFGLPRALWQVHCGRIDSYIGGKWIVITCLFLMTLGWVPSDLLQEFWIGLPPSLQAGSWLSRLAGGRYKPSLHRSRAQPLRGYTSVKQSVRFVKLSSKNAAVIDVCFSLFVLIQTSQDGQADGGEREETNKKCAMAALLGMVVDSLWKPRREGSIQYMLPPLAWLKRGMDEGCELNNFIPWIIQG